MAKKLGGRGNKVPYDTIMMRVPQPIKTEVEALTEAYRKLVVPNYEGTDTNPVNLTEFLSALKLVDSFIEELGQANNLHQRNNTNLVKFRNWLIEKSANSDSQT